MTELIVHTISQKTGKHKLSTVAHSVDGTVLDNKSLITSQESLKGSNDSAQVRLVAGVVHGPLSIKNVMKGNQVLVLVHGTAANTTKFLHVRTNTKEETKVHAKSSDIGTSLTADPEDTQVAVIVEFDELALVDGSDTELTLNGRDQRRTLEQSTSEGLEGTGELGLTARQLVVEADDADVFLSCALLGLDETSSAVNADNQTSRNLGIEGTAVASLLDTIAAVSQNYSSLEISLPKVQRTEECA